MNCQFNLAFICSDIQLLIGCCAKYWKFLKITQKHLFYLHLLKKLKNKKLPSKSSSEKNAPDRNIFNLLFA